MEHWYLIKNLFGSLYVSRRRCRHRGEIFRSNRFTRLELIIKSGPKIPNARVLVFEWIPIYIYRYTTIPIEQHRTKQKQRQQEKTEKSSTTTFEGEAEEEEEDIVFLDEL